MALSSQDFRLFDTNQLAQRSEIPLPGPPYQLFFPVASYQAEAGGLVASRQVTLHATRRVYHPRLLLARDSTGSDRIYLNVGGNRYGCGYLAASVNAGATTIQVQVADGQVPIFRAGEDVALLVPQGGGPDAVTFTPVSAASVSGNVWTLTVAALPKAFTGGLDAGGAPYTYVASAYDPPRDLGPYPASPDPIAAMDNAVNTWASRVFDPAGLTLYPQGLPPRHATLLIEIDGWAEPPGFVDLFLSVQTGPGGQSYGAVHINAPHANRLSGTWDSGRYRLNRGATVVPLDHGDTARPMVEVDLVGFLGDFATAPKPLYFWVHLYGGAIDFTVEQRLPPGAAVPFSSTWRIALYGESI